MKIKSNVQSAKQAQAQKTKLKPKVNKKRLFLIFFTAFVGFFFLCTLVASLITPKIDVPALDNENNLSSVSSDDFKGRLDPRLKDIERDEGPAGSTTPNPFNSKPAQKENDVDVSTINDQGYTEPKVQQTRVEEEKLPYDSRESSNNDPVTDDSYDQDQDEDVQPQPQSQPKKVVKQAPKKDASQQQNLILRDKLKVQHETPATINKVMVGTYSDLNEARRVSQELTDSNLNVTPFIKERNGVYSLQVGTFSNSQKASKLASDLKKRNLDSRIVQD